MLLANAAENLWSCDESSDDDGDEHERENDFDVDDDQANERTNDMRLLYENETKRATEKRSENWVKIRYVEWSVRIGSVSVCMWVRTARDRLFNVCVGKNWRITSKCQYV